MNPINIQLLEAVNNPSPAKVDELRFSLRSSGPAIPSGGIKWKSGIGVSTTVRVATANNETTQTVNPNNSVWCTLAFASQDCDVFISPKSVITEFQLAEDVSEHVVLDWPTSIYSGVTKLLLRKSCIDPSVLPLLTSVTQWTSIGNQQEIDFDLFTKMSSLTYLYLQDSAVGGDLRNIGALTQLQTITLIDTPNLDCWLGYLPLCGALQSITCSDNITVHGALEDLLPLSGTLTSLQLNGAVNVQGNLKSLKNLPLVTSCSLGSSGVRGTITDLNGMKTSGTLQLRASGYITNDLVSPSTMLNDNQIYTITFSNGVVSSVV